METGNIGFGVIGSGYIAKKVLKDIKSECGKIAVYSRNLSTAEKLAAATGADVYGDFDLFLQDDKINCVYIATPHPSHYHYLTEAISAGKAVICEKPLVMNVKQFDAVKKLSDDKHVFFTEIMWFRYSPLFSKLKELSGKRVLGEMKEISINIGFDAFVLPKRKRLLDPQAGGGALLDIGVYMLSVLEFLLGDAVLSGDAEIITEFSSQKVDIYDRILIKTNGVVCKLECSLKSVLPTELEVGFSNGSVRFPMFFRPGKMIVTDGEKTTELTDDFSYKQQFVSNFSSIHNGETESAEYLHSSIRRTLALMDRLREKSGIIYDDSIEKA